MMDSYDYQRVSCRPENAVAGEQGHRRGRAAGSAGSHNGHCPGPAVRAVFFCWFVLASQALDEVLPAVAAELTAAGGFWVLRPDSGGCGAHPGRQQAGAGGPAAGWQCAGGSAAVEVKTCCCGCVLPRRGRHAPGPAATLAACCVCPPCRRPHRRRAGGAGGGGAGVWGRHERQGVQGAAGRGRHPGGRALSARLFSAGLWRFLRRAGLRCCPARMQWHGQTSAWLYLPLLLLHHRPCSACCHVLPCLCRRATASTTTTSRRYWRRSWRRATPCRCVPASARLLAALCGSLRAARRHCCQGCALQDPLACSPGCRPAAMPAPKPVPPLPRPWPPQSVAFGMGGGLLQRVNRDTLSLATKLSHIVYADGTGEGEALRCAGQRGAPAWLPLQRPTPGRGAACPLGSRAICQITLHPASIQPCRALPCCLQRWTP